MEPIFYEQGGHSLSDAMSWPLSLLSGPLSLSIASVAVVCFGMLLLDGRIRWRRGISVVLGCFLVFGAPTLTRAFDGVNKRPSSASDGSTSPDLKTPSLNTTASEYDPYAGAAVIYR